MASPDPFVSLFRASSPYIHAHRGRTLVVLLAGESLAHPNLPGTVHDLALLHSMGIRLVLVLGARPQIDAALATAGLEAPVHKGLRATPPAAMAVVRDVAAGLRAQLEGLFSTGLPGSPMANTRIRVVGGNFVTARPLGVVDGVDMGCTGAVRRVHSGAIRSQLDLGNLVLLPCTGTSASGELFNLQAEQLALATAVGLGADKLVAYGPDDGVTIDDELRTEVTPAELRALPDCPPLPLALADAVDGGVARAHLLNHNVDGVLLTELFTREGAGTQVVAAHADVLRAATLDDLPGIIQLIRPLEEAGALVARSRATLEQELDRFLVAELEGLVIGCAALNRWGADGELACLAVHPDYRERRLPGVPPVGDLLLEAICRRAKAASLGRLYVLTTRTEHWFLEHGFAPCSPADLPPGKAWNEQRNARVLVRALG